MKNKILSSNGFSLIELLVCLIIFAVLTAAAVPYYLQAIQSTRNTEAIIWWNSVKRFSIGKNMTRERADRMENEVNNNGKLKYFSLKIICREKTNESEPCWEGELHLKNTTQHIQYYLTSQKNFQELLCIPLNSAGNSFCQAQSGQDEPLEYTIDDKKAYLMQF